MKKYCLILLVPLVLFLASTSFATVEVTVFGNTGGTFYRAKNLPFTEHRTFPGVSGKATVKLFNGANSKNMVTDATIRVNGSIVFDEMQIKRSVQYLEKEINLFDGQNDLEVFLEGKPGSKITILITQRIEGDAGAVIGSSGGTLSTPGGNATLTVPPDALNSDVIITAKQITGGTPPGFIPGTVYTFEPSGIQFSKPVIVDIKYNPGSLPAEYIENDLFMGWVENSKWVTIPSSTVDALNDVVRGTFTHFTEIAIVAPPKLQISNNFSGPWGNILEMEDWAFVRGSVLTSSNDGRYWIQLFVLGQTTPCGAVFNKEADSLFDPPIIGFDLSYIIDWCGIPNSYQTYKIVMIDRISDLSSNEVTLTLTAPSEAEKFTRTTGKIKFERSGHTATLLEETGKVLITGGTYSKTAEIYNPASDAFETTGDMTVARYKHTATLLLNGKLLITGGILPGGTTFYNTAEIFDPVLNTFQSTTGVMESPRAYHTATLLPDGKVLIAGGYSQNLCGSNPNYAEIYDPATDSFTKTSNMNSDRSLHQATLLPNRTVLITGGYSCSLATLDTAEIYDPNTNEWKLTSGNMDKRRSNHTATLVRDGDFVLIAGGSWSSWGNTFENYSLYANAFFPLTTIVMDKIRFYHTATPLLNGQVLIAGGTPDGIDILDTAEIFNPYNVTIRQTSENMSTKRLMHTATRLLDGRVLITGMGEYADIYTPGP